MFILRKTKLGLGVIIAGVIFSSVISADTIEMFSGSILHGKITNEQKQFIKFLPEGKDKPIDTETIYTFRIKRTIKGNAYKEYLEAKDKCKTADDFYKLGDKCKSQKLADEANLMWGEAVKLDPEHEKSRKALGHKKESDKWLTPDETKESEGYVKFKDQWVKKDQLEKVKADDLKKQYASAHPINLKIGIIVDVDEAWLEGYKERIKGFAKFLWTASDGMLYLNNIDVSDMTGGGDFVVVTIDQKYLPGKDSEAYLSCSGQVEMSGLCSAAVFVRQCGFLKINHQRHDGCLLAKDAGSYAKFCDACLSKVMAFSANVKYRPDFPAEPPEVNIKCTNNSPKK
jgi:hypothetical protein